LEKIIFDCESDENFGDQEDNEFYSQEDEDSSD